MIVVISTLVLVRDDRLALKLIRVRIGIEARGIAGHVKLTGGHVCAGGIVAEEGAGGGEDGLELDTNLGQHALHCHCHILAELLVGGLEAEGQLGIHAIAHTVADAVISRIGGIPSLVEKSSSLGRIIRFSLQAGVSPR